MFEQIEKIRNKEDLIDFKVLAQIIYMGKIYE